MSEEIPLAPLISDGLDPAPQPKPTIAQLKDAVEATVRGVGGAVKAARQPGH
jgi:hypothetical protein